MVKLNSTIIHLKYLKYDLLLYYNFIILYPHIVFFSVVAAESGEQKAVGTTYLHMQIVTDASVGRRKNIYMELTLPQFYAFLHELEKAKSGLNFLG